MSRARRLLLGLPAAGAACVAWGVVEARLHRVRTHVIAVLPPGARPVSILQVSDLHLRTNSGRLRRFVESLGEETYDVVLATGDLIGQPEALDACAGLLNGLKAREGRFFVLGSSDYYAPTFKNYFDYFTGRRRHGTRRNDTERFKKLMTGAGWEDLTNRDVRRSVAGLRWQVTGLDDPYLHRDDRSLLVRDREAGFALCVVHDPAPYAEAAAAGYDLIVSGHTHGGQVRLPFLGAVVTNSTIPRSLARGTARVGDSWLHVNPGLGTGRYAPFRFMCPPEASLLRCVPRPGPPTR